MKKWIKPELVVLVRSKPEEAVLAVCKDSSLNGPDFENSWCAPTGNCGAYCDSYSST